MPKKGYKQTETHKKSIKINNAKYWLNRKLSRESIQKRTLSRQKYKTSEATKEKIRIAVSKTKQKIRKERLGDNYGLTPLQIQEKIAGRSKTNYCEICKKSGKTQFDHDHKSGKFRGWICWRCNIVLGLIKDDMQVSKKITVYLKKNNSQNK